MTTNLPALQSGGTAMAIVPQSMDEAYRLAKAVCMAGMAPKGLDKPESCMLAIMHGMEVGLKPLSALQRIAIVNGRPTIWGDGAIGLVRGSGLCEYVKESVTGEGERAVATCEAKRKGEPHPVVRTFSAADAKKAGLWNKQGPWQQYPMRMLQMRARAFCLRDLFADVLGGLYLKEEVEDEGRSVAPPRASEQRITTLPPRASQSAPALAAPEQPAEVEIDWQQQLDGYENALSGCGGMDEFAEALEHVGSVFADAPESVRGEARKLEEAFRASLERQAAA